MTIGGRRYISRSALVALVAGGWCFAAPSAVYAQAVIYPGVDASFDSGATQVNTRGATSVLYNPANIFLSRRLESYADMTILHVQYSYTKPGYDPVAINITAPPVNFGFSWKPRPVFALGGFFIPRPGGDKGTELKNLPLDTGPGTVMLVDATATSTTFITGVGGAFMPAKNLMVGLSVIQTAEDSQFIAREAGTSDDAHVLAAMRTQGIFYQLVAGARYRLDDERIIAGSFKNAVERKYKGTQIVKGDQDNDIMKQGYDPSTLSIGMEYQKPKTKFFGEIHRAAWSAGASSSKSGLPGGTGDRDYVDTYDLILGGRFLISDDGKVVSASYGYYPANVGNGSYLSSGGGGRVGPSIGEMENLNRHMISGKFSMGNKKFDFRGGINFITGSRSVPEGYSGSGKYSLTTITVGGGGNWYF
jgi:hypothetical protein